MMKKEYDVIIFTDGSSRGNPGPGGWGTLLVLNHRSWVEELGGAKSVTTNNEMELTAIKEALEYLATRDKSIKALLLSDSSYALNGIQSWLSSWKKRGWKTATSGEIANLSIWQEIDCLKDGVNVTYQHIKGHSGVPGNERVDAIATAYADDIDPRLYSGSLKSYGIPNVLDITAREIPTKSKSRSTHNPNAWYISMVDRQVKRHTTWESCKSRVHGVKARFKKVSTKDEEEAILKEWKCESQLKS